MVDHIGEQFGNYRLIRLLGQGAFAEVYQGEHIHLSTQAAIKLLHKRLAPEDVEQFRDEARLLAHFDHPYIVKVLDFGIQNNTPFLVMTYAPNGTLRQKHPKGIAVPLMTVITYINQIASALQYAHFRKHVHRDIKPQNILIGHDQHLLLSDFGISIAAHDFHSLTPQIALGTPPYMAPEQFQGKALRASDQYSLGVTVYEWLCGELPFTGDLFSLMNQHSTKPPPSLREKNPLISVEVENVIFKALAKDPQDRFDQVSAFARALEQACFAEQHSHKQSPAGTLLHSYQVPQGSIYSFSWMQNRPRLAIGDTNGKIEAWDFTTGSLFSHQIEGQNAHISWSPNGQRLACFAWHEDEATAKLQLWNPETESCLATYTKAWEPLIWSPDGTCIAFRSYKQTPHQDHLNFKNWMASDYKDQIFQIWYIDQAQLISTLSAFRGSTGELIPLEYEDQYNTSIYQKMRPVWSPDGKYIAFSPQIDPSYRWVIPVYEVATGNFITACPLPDPTVSQETHGGSVNGVKGGRMWRLMSYKGDINWSPDATYIACSIHYSYKGSRPAEPPDNPFWEKKVLRRYKAQIWAIAAQSATTIRSLIGPLAWSPDSACVAFSSRKEIAKYKWIPTVEIWDVATKREHLEVYKGHAKEIIALVWSPDNKRIASASPDGEIHIWDAYSKKRILILETHLPITSAKVEWSQNGTQLALIEQEGLIQVWQVG